MYLDGNSIHLPQDVVNSFADHFSSTFDNVLADIDIENILESSNDMASLINIKSISLDEVILAMKSIKGKQTCGEDQIPAFLLKDCAAYLAPAVHSIINLILSSGVFSQKSQR